MSTGEISQHSNEIRNVTQPSTAVSKGCIQISQLMEKELSTHCTGTTRDMKGRKFKFIGIGNESNIHVPISTVFTSSTASLTAVEENMKKSVYI